MIYPLQGINFLEANQNCSSAVVAMHRNTTDRGEEEYFEDGDILIFGSIPPHSMCTEVLARITAGFGPGSTIDFGIPVWENDEIVDINVLDTFEGEGQFVFTLDLDAEIFNTEAIPEPVGSYLLSTSGSQYLLARLNIPTPNTTGQVNFVASYKTYGIRTGSYT